MQKKFYCEEINFICVCVCVCERVGADVGHPFTRAVWGVFCKPTLSACKNYYCEEINLIFVCVCVCELVLMLGTRLLVRFGAYFVRLNFQHTKI